MGTPVRTILRLGLLALAGMSPPTGPRCCGEEPRGRAALEGHTDYVLAVIFSPDGKTLSACGTWLRAGR
jgi:hypothetical protein